MRLIYICLVALPLAFSRPSPAFIPVYSLLCLLAAGVGFLKLEQSDTARLFALTGPLFLVSLFCVLQSTPLPPSWLQTAAPQAWHAYAQTIWILQPVTWMPISTNIEQTLLAGLFVTSLGGLCLVISQIAQTSSALHKLSHAVAVSVSIWAVAAISCSTLLLVLSPGSATVNEGLASFHRQCLFWEISLFPVVLAGHAASRPTGRRRSLAEQLRAYRNAPTDSMHIMHSIAIVLVSVSIFVTLSPLYATATLAGLWLLSTFKQKLKQKGSSVSAVLAVIGCAGLIWSGGLLDIYVRHASTQHVDAFIIPPQWLFTWFGCGLGAQSEILGATMTAPESIVGAGLNGLTSLWLGLGACGFFLVLLACSVLISCGNQYRSLKLERMAQSMYAGSLSSLIIIICLGWVDAGLNWDALLAGVFLTASLATGARACQPWTFEHGKRRVEGGTWLTWSLTVVTLSLFLAGSFYLGASYWTRFSLAQELPERKYDSNEAFVTKSMAMSEWLPFDSALKLDLGFRYLDLGKLPEAYRMFSEAVSLRPLSSEALVAAVTAAAELGQESLSLKLLESETIGGFRGGRRLEHLVARILKQPQSTFTRKFLDMAFASDPSNSSRYLNLMILSGYSLETLRNHLPPRAETIMAYGDMLLAYGEKTSAEIAYIEAVYLNSKNNRNVDVYMHVIDYFARDDQLSKAMVVALEGLDRLPNNPELDNMVAELSIQLGPDGRLNRRAGE